MRFTYPKNEHEYYRMDERLYINIYIAIYNYNRKGYRYELTEKIFKHYKLIQEAFKDKIRFTFTIQGSEKAFSRELSDRYFDKDSYVEFDQENVQVGHQKFWYMFGNKINKGFRIGTSKQADISFWAGSNDYISMDFFEQVHAFYKKDVPQIYGIDRYTNGENVICVFHYTRSKIDILDTTNNDIFWYTGAELHNSREKYQYTGGIIGINKQCYTMYPDILDKWGLDEGINEKNVLDKKNVEKFNSKMIVFLNPKIEANNDITNYKILTENIQKSKLDVSTIRPEIQTKMREEYERFMSL